MRSGTFCHSRDVVWRRSLDAVLVLPAGAEEPVTLAGSGPELWELLATPTSMADLASAIAERYGVDAAVVAQDVDATLEHLLKLGVVEERPAEPAR